MLDPNESAPKTVDSLEVSAVPPVLTAMLQTGAILVGKSDVPRLRIYEDYACFYCREFASSDLTWLERTYGESLAFERIIAPTTAAGTVMAKTAVCALKQGKFHQADVAMLAKPIATETEAAALAKNLKLNVTSFKACMGSKDTMGFIASMQERKKSDAITRVPSFVIGEESWIGIINRTELRKIIDASL